MPVIRVKEIRDMSPEDRSKRLSDYRTELVRMKTMIGAGGTVENPARVKLLRRAIAKILTIDHEEILKARSVKEKPKEKPREKTKESPKEKPKEKPTKEKPTEKAKEKATEKAKPERKKKK